MGHVKRVCQPCTACCDGWVQMVIDGVAVYPGRPCPHSTGEGCDDCENRPIEPCHNFNCGWISPDSPLPDWLRPDIGKVIVVPAKLVWRGVPVDLAVPVGRRIPPRSLEWLKRFSAAHRPPLIYTEQIVEEGQHQREQNALGFGPPAFQEDLLRWQREGRRLW